MSRVTDVAFVTTEKADGVRDAESHVDFLQKLWDRVLTPLGPSGCIRGIANTLMHLLIAPTL